ncbi:hypothetical protein CGLO_11494 [Colletotrichum gloeosporioides Cg-14]|uniref:Myb-like DNA-binding domain-containing protein n=1 Tax=Colletotrichum gloeosporioides (strain Cg-14) TaxID=1237896 RepID=T0LBR7_COLGC|nr:hypothetical protein CGLO_11494 [Colletotrichum gloeosporioides Cg-14]
MSTPVGTDAEGQVKFLVNCIRFSNNGRVDFEAVATECNIASKGAAAKRFSRLLQQHGMKASDLAKPGPAGTASPAQTPTGGTPKTPAKSATKATPKTKSAGKRTAAAASPSTNTKRAKLAASHPAVSSYNDEDDEEDHEEFKVKKEESHSASAATGSYYENPRGRDRDDDDLQLLYVIEATRATSYSHDTIFPPTNFFFYFLHTAIAMDDSVGAPRVDIEQDWDSSSDASTPRSATSTSTLFSNPDSPASSVDTEMSFPSSGSDAEKQSPTSKRTNFMNLPNHPNHTLLGQKIYAPGQLMAMRDELDQARKTGEFPNTASSLKDPKIILEDYQYLQCLRDALGDPSVYPPPQRYNQLKIEIARRIKIRDEAEGGSAKLEEMDNRVQSWMGSINKEARMLEITQAALQRKGISNPTQADLDAIAEEFMQIAERTLLDVANPLRMNATRMEGNISRFDNQLSGFDGAMTAQLNGLSDLNSAVNTSMSAQVNTLNTILTAQSSTFNGSLNMLNTSLNTVTSDLQKLTASLPGIIAAATQAAVQQQLANASHQNALPQPHHVATEAPPSYIRNAASIHFPPTPTTPLPVYYHATQETSQGMSQQNTKSLETGRAPSASRLRRFLVRITRIWGFKERKSQKEGILA